MAVNINDVGIKAHLRYIEDQKNLEPFLVQETDVARRAETNAIIPNRFPEIDQLFGVEKRNSTWAFFSSPEVANVFLSKIIPSLGDLSEQIEKLSSFPDSKEKESIMKFLTTLTQLDKYRIDIENRMNQYVRG